MTSHRLLAAAVWTLFALAIGDRSVAENRVDFFETKIRPVLVKHCYECHSADSDDLGGKLRVDDRPSMLVGGESGPVLVAGSPDESLIIQALRYDGLEMPPEAPLPERIINHFETWVSLGAIDPREPAAGDSPAARSDTVADEGALWSFVPRKTPAVPTVRDPGWPASPIDRFVLSSMEQAGLQPTEDADPRVLVRRLHHDLIGLRPTSRQIEAFVADFERHGRDATTRLVDRLLNSPQFGVRWGRHWLDVARYGESNGDDGLGRNATFPNAWRYRDYVIDAFNRDVPYDRFVTEQIAGDLLPADTTQQRNRQLVATGFLAIGSKPASAMNKDFAMDIVDDQINVVCTAVLGLSVACARCHDHKHDPIPTRDYYALAGIFRSTETLYGAAGNEKLTAPPTPLHELHEPSSQPVGVRPAVPLGFAMGVRDKAKPADCKIHINGTGSKLGPVVARGVLSAYRELVPDDVSNSAFDFASIEIDPAQSGRLQLARWLTQPDHPQTARVMVNRIWMHLFGRGIVTTPDDFGVYGSRPSHPELLDHLANRFVREGWSIKRLIRAIVLSRTYQISSHARAEMLEKDPENIWLSRHVRKRLDAESLRDAMLQASGQIDYAPAKGSAIVGVDMLINWPPGESTNLHRPSRHRSVYLCMLRHAPPKELAAFDLPDGVSVRGQRDVTTLPTQSLFLINGQFVVQQSRELARSVLDKDLHRDGDRVKAIFAAVLGRDPGPSEREQSLAYVRATETTLAADVEDRQQRRLHAWASLAQALMTTNEFRYVD